MRQSTSLGVRMRLGTGPGEAGGSGRVLPSLGRRDGPSRAQERAWHRLGAGGAQGRDAGGGVRGWMGSGPSPLGAGAHRGHDAQARGPRARLTDNQMQQPTAAAA